MNRSSLPLLLFLLFIGPGSILGQLSIADARAEALGTTVTVRGIVLNGAEMGSIRFLQDATAGIAAYPGSGSVSGFGSVSRGDSVQITGVLTDYNGLLELSPILDYEVLAQNVPLPEPLSLPDGQLSEEVEGQLLELPCGQFFEQGSFSSGQYGFHLPQGEEVTVYLAGNSALIGEHIPDEAINLIGIASEYNGQYQLLPRDANDLQSGASCLLFMGELVPEDIQPFSLQLSWTTSIEAQGGVYYGTDPDNLNNFVAETQATTEHSLTLTDLEPATFYYLRVQAASNGVEINSAVQLFATASLSSGNMDVYFNQWTDPSFSSGVYPAGTGYEAVEAAIIERIDAAQESISVCMYNVSRDNFIDALVDAHQRGVVVRYIADSETTNSALQPPPPFPVLYGSPADGIMHNKTLVIDPNEPDAAYVITGSMNMTFSNVINAFNNTLIIQDQTLARAYLAEFNEMWGGAGENPNLSGARFGIEKTENTPRQFNIGGVPVELYFSPSDGTNSAILRALQTADAGIDFALLLFTKGDLADALVALHDNGRQLRGLMENVDEWGTEFYYLKDEGVPVYEHWQDGQLHHKYAIVDEGVANGDPLVITGSHNWTNAADNVNDENTLILHDADIANLFRQEFEARWGEVVAVFNPPQLLADWQLYPNPADDFVHLAYARKSGKPLSWAIFDLYGRVLLQGEVALAMQGVLQIDIRQLPAGSYLFSLSDGSSKMLVVP